MMGVMKVCMFVSVSVNFVMRVDVFAVLSMDACIASMCCVVRLVQISFVCSGSLHVFR